MLRIMPPQEKTLTLTFDVTMTEAKGMLNIAFPSIVSSALIRKLKAEMVYQRARGVAVNQDSIGQRLLQSKVPLELATPASPSDLPTCWNCRWERYLALEHGSMNRPCSAYKGHDCWLARPVSSGNNSRAAQLLCYVEPPEKEDER